MNSQKIKIAEKICNIVNDIRDVYVGNFGPTEEWSSIDINLYFLNCDTEIHSLLEKHNIELHDDVLSLGLSFSVVIIQRETERIFSLKYGNMMDYAIKEEMYQQTFLNIYDYIVNGIER